MYQMIAICTRWSQYVPVGHNMLYYIVHPDSCIVFLVASSTPPHSFIYASSSLHLRLLVASFTQSCRTSSAQPTPAGWRTVQLGTLFAYLHTSYEFYIQVINSMYRL